MGNRVQPLLVSLAMPLAIAGVVCWLTPWLAVPEAFLYDRFVRSRPERRPPASVMVVLWADSPTSGAADGDGGSAAESDFESPELLSGALRAMEEADPAVVALSGDTAARIASSLVADAGKSASPTRHLSVISLTAVPAGDALRGPEGKADSLVLWWDHSSAWGDPVYLRKLAASDFPAAEGASSGETRRAPSARPQGAAAIEGLPDKPGDGVLMAALRPLPSVPLWSHEHLRATGWYGPAGTFPHVTVRELAEGRVAREVLSRSVVVLGRRGDVRATPMGEMTCAEAHANLVATMMEGQWIVAMPSWWHWLIIFTGSVLAAVVVASAAGGVALVVILFEVACVGMVARGALQTNQWFCCMPALAAIGLSALAALALSLGRARSEEARLAHEMRLRDELISAIAHDIRQPMTLISLFVERITAKLGDGNAVELDPALLAGVLRGLRAMDCEVDRMLYANPDRVLRPRLAPTLVREVVADAVDDLGAIARRREVTVVGPDACIEADHRCLRHALLNLLRNAVEYSPEGGPITVTIEDVGPEVRIAVSDKGIGIARNQQARIFERFARAVPPELKLPGTGLGLYVVKRVVDAHAGRIEVDSTLGEGSTFTVVLPKQAPGEPQPAEGVLPTPAAVVSGRGPLGN